MSVPILTIVRGLPGSGKSTYARKLADRCPLYHGRGLGSQEGGKQRIGFFRGPALIVREQKKPDDRGKVVRLLHS